MAAADVAARTACGGVRGLAADAACGQQPQPCCQHVGNGAAFSSLRSRFASALGGLLWDNSTSIVPR